MELKLWVFHHFVHQKPYLRGSTIRKPLLHIISLVRRLHHLSYIQSTLITIRSQIKSLFIKPSCPPLFQLLAFLHKETIIEKQRSFLCLHLFQTPYTINEYCLSTRNKNTPPLPACLRITHCGREVITFLRLNFLWTHNQWALATNSTIYCVEYELFVHYLII